MLGSPPYCMGEQENKKAIKLAPCMDPTAYFHHPFLAEEFIVSAVGVSMDIALVVAQESKGTLLAPIRAKIIHRQGRPGPPAHIDPQPCLLDPAPALDLKGDHRVVREKDVDFQHHLLYAHPPGA